MVAGEKVEDFAEDIIDLLEGEDTVGIEGDRAGLIEEDGLGQVAFVVVAGFGFVVVVFGGDGVDDDGDEVGGASVEGVELGDDGDVFFAVAAVVGVEDEKGGAFLVQGFGEADAGGDEGAVACVEGEDIAVEVVVGEDGVGG